MASGKTTVGPLLADALGVRFVDLDWLVEARTGRTVAALFADGGEAGFREAEAEALAETANGPDLVVATGGGTLVRSTNMALAQAAGAVVWLRVPPDVVLARIGVPHDRPLLAGPDGWPLRGEALSARVRAVMEARAPHYARADAVVDADAPPDEVVRRVLAAFGVPAS